MTAPPLSRIGGGLRHPARCVTSHLFSLQGVQSGPGTSIQIFDGTDLVTKPVAGAHFLTFNKGDVVRVVVNNLPANANGESCQCCSTHGLPWAGTVVHAGPAKSLATACKHAAQSPGGNRVHLYLTCTHAVMQQSGGSDMLLPAGMRASVFWMWISLDLQVEIPDPALHQAAPPAAMLQSSTPCTCMASITGCWVQVRRVVLPEEKQDSQSFGSWLCLSSSMQCDHQCCNSFLMESKGGACCRRRHIQLIAGQHAQHSEPHLARHQHTAPWGLDCVAVCGRQSRTVSLPPG